MTALIIEHMLWCYFIYFPPRHLPLFNKFLFLFETKLQKMKNTFVLIAAMLCVGALSAQDLGKVFGSPTVVWYGLDFTKAKMIGFKDESPHKIRDEYFKVWNDYMNEVDLVKTFQKKAVIRDPLGVFKLDLARETETLVSTDEKELTADQLAENAKAVPVGQKKEGVGVFGVVQSFNKTTDVATIYIVFFDIASRNVLLAKKVTGKPSGGNPKTAWVGAVKDIFSKIEKKEFSAWKKEANY
jgi:hypothetical protein